MPTNALGLIETKGLVGLYLAADAVTKTAPFAAMRKLQAGGGYHLLWFEGDLAAVKLAVDAAHSAIGGTPEFVNAFTIPLPHPELFSLLRGFAPPPQGETPAIGCIEMKGMIAALAAVDAACKAAEVRCGGLEYCGDGFILATLAGSIAAVQAALEGARGTAERFGGAPAQGLLTRPLPECAAFILSSALPQTGAPMHAAPPRIARLPRIAPPLLPDAEPIPVAPAPPVAAPAPSSAPPKRRGRPPGKRNETPPVGRPAETKEPRKRIRTGMKAFPALSFEEKIGMFAEYEQMPVWQLRKVARQTEGLGIFGRDISKANKELLLEELKRAMALG